MRNLLPVIHTPSVLAPAGARIARGYCSRSRGAAFCQRRPREAGEPTPFPEPSLENKAIKDHDRVTLSKGGYSLFIRVRAGKVTPEGLPLLIQFVESDDVAAETADWIESVRRSKDIL